MKGKRLTAMALLTAVSLIMFKVEAQIPAPVPIPGVKHGLANIITVYAMFSLGPRDTLLILLARVVLGSICLTGQKASSSNTRFSRKNLARSGSLAAQSSIAADLFSCFAGFPAKNVV